MTGKELADKLFQAFDDGRPGDDSALVDEIIGGIKGLSPEEMWWFVIQATTNDRARKDRTPMATFNAAAAQRQEFKDALSAMRSAPRPDRPAP